MNDKELSELFADVADAMYNAAQSVLDEAQVILDNVSSQLNDWVASLAEEAGTDEVDQYQFILDNSSGAELAMFQNLEWYFRDAANAAVLDSIYQSKTEETTTDNPFDFWEKFTNKNQ